MKNSKLLLILHAVLASFGAYFCMYAFRKPFAVASFHNMVFFGIDYKILLVIAQVLGYMLSKFFGIKIISELKNTNRAILIVLLILVAEVSLVLFAITPSPYNIIFMFINGLPLGLIWGIVFSYLEGRRSTEILGLALCSSFIVSSGAVKSVGLLTIQHFGVSQFWMPAVTGSFFILPLAFFAWLLEKIPPPTVEDQRLRTARVPMQRQDRVALIKKFIFPLVVLVLFYAILTAFRDFRDNFSRELWDALGYSGDASVYTLSELPIAFLVLISLSFLGLIKGNFKAFVYYHYTLLFGIVFTGLATLFYQFNMLSPYLWMVAVGFGLYVCYVPFNCIFFDRMVAAFSIKGNSGFLIYIADSFGYLASIVVLFYKNFGQGNISWLRFFLYGTYALSFVGMVTTVCSLVYFRTHKKQMLNLDNYTLDLHGNKL